MRVLNLRKNRLTYSTGKCSLEAMAENGGLQAVDLRGNCPHLGLLTVCIIKCIVYLLQATTPPLTLLGVQTSPHDYVRV
jgi:hypothetical protein